jgi:tricorn protease-like protein
MWILTEAPKGSNFFEAQSLTGNKVLISDTCETVIYARSQGTDGQRIIAQRGREIFLIGPAPVRGVEADMTAQMLAIAKQMGAVVLT